MASLDQVIVENFIGGSFCPGEKHMPRYTQIPNILHCLYYGTLDIFTYKMRIYKIKFFFVRIDRCLLIDLVIEIANKTKDDNIDPYFSHNPATGEVWAFIPDAGLQEVREQDKIFYGPVNNGQKSF